MLEKVKYFIQTYDNAADYIEAKKKHIYHLLETADNVVIMGLSPVGCQCIQNIRNFVCTENIYCMDKRRGIESKDIVGCKIIDNDVFPAFCENQDSVLCIICSREQSLDYYHMACKRAQILSYNDLFLISECFSIPESLFHNRSYVVGRIRNVFDHFSIYETICENLSDKISKEYLESILLYRITLNIGLFDSVHPEQTHYFDDQIIKLTSAEVFVDAGGYNGDTLGDFLRKTDNQYTHYYLFEPSEELIDAAKKKFSDDRISFEQYGLHRENGIMCFDLQNASEQGKITTEGENQIKCTALDVYPFEYIPTYIKMDIEGSEMAALHGGYDLIGRYTPKLAVCIYHLANDIIDVYDFCVKCGYKQFYIRCGERTYDYDVIMYALA